MAKKVSSDQLVYWAEGPKKKEPEYQFQKRTFKRYPEKPGQFKDKFNDYTQR